MKLHNHLSLWLSPHFLDHSQPRTISIHSENYTVFQRLLKALLFSSVCAKKNSSNLRSEKVFASALALDRHQFRGIVRAI